MSDLYKKEQQAIRFLKSISIDQPIEVSYSGGKDSDVILALTQMSSIPYRAIYKNTTIDPKGTIKHALEKGAEIIKPKMSFFKIIEKKGFPTMRARFCCEILKEYKVLDHAIIGVRRQESVRRAKRYKEPEQCRVYSNAEKVHQYYPILEWSNEDVKEFITKNEIQVHPLYYDDCGNFHVERRLGCVGCPLKSDRGVSDFKKNPKMLRAWIKSGKKWFDAPRDKPLSSKMKFGDIYSLLYSDLFCSSYSEFQVDSIQLFGKRDFKSELENYFKIELP